MSGQLSYSYQTPKGIAGSLIDISPYAIDSRINAEVTTGVLKFGMGAMQGDIPGVNVLVPIDTMSIEQFEGVVMTGFTQMHDLEGNVAIPSLATVGVLQFGRAWVRIPDGVEPVYGESVYLIVDGDDAGLFSNDDDGGANLAINGTFIGGPGTGSIAPAIIYNQKPV